MCLCAVTVASITIVVASCNLAIDRALFDWVMAIFTGHPAAAPVLTAAPAAEESVALLLIAVLATWAGFKLQHTVRLIVSFQLLVLSALAMWGLWSAQHFAGHPTCFVSAIIFGQLGGWVVAVIDKHLRKSEAQNYELILRNRELMETKLQMVKQDEVERRLLAADLHDQVLNDLKSIRNTLAGYFEKPDPKTAGDIDQALERSMREIRDVMDSLCPFSLEILGLPAALDECLRRSCEKGGFRGKLRNSLKADDLDGFSVVELSLLYRLVQESLTNVCKHAAASVVKITMEKRDQALAIMVIDDGKGIDVNSLTGQSRGLGYMRQRADLIGATVNWRRGDDGKGTVVEILMSLAGNKSDNNPDS